MLEGKTIVSLTIRHTGPKTLDDARLKYSIGSKPGLPYSSERLDADLECLYEKGYIEDGRFLAEPDAGGVRLTAEVLTRWPCGRGPTISGNRAFSDDRLAKVSGGAGELLLSYEGIESARQRIESHYKQHGYSNAKVTVKITANTLGTEDLQFMVDEGEMDPTGHQKPNKAVLDNRLHAPSLNDHRN
jgi:outer membrane protein assembly factor BamA